MSYVIKAQLKIDSAKTSLSSPQSLGKSITLSASASGGDGTKKYRFVVMNSNRITFVQDYSTSTSATWKPTERGNYTIYIKVKDGNSKEVQKSISFVIK